MSRRTTFRKAGSSVSGPASELERQAMAAYRRGEKEAAADGFASAMSSYRDGGDTRKAAEMANNLCVVLVDLGRGEEAVRVVEGTAAVFAAAGDAVMAAKATGNLAAALESIGRLEESAAAYERALDGFRSAGDRTSESETWQALSRLQLRRGDPYGAAASAQAALESSPKPGPFRRLLRSLTGRAFRFPKT
jgi:tetratricopeptide (TPR) repeat protein